MLLLLTMLFNHRAIPEISNIGSSLQCQVHPIIFQQEVRKQIRPFY